MKRSGLATVALALAACANPVAPPVPAELEVLHGPTAISVPGQRYDTIAVRLTGSRGESIVGWPVTWSGDGEVVPLDSVTDDVGIARAQWTLPRNWEVWDDIFDGPEGVFSIAANALGFETTRHETTARAFHADMVSAAFAHGCGLRGPELWCWSNPYPLQNRLRQPHQVPLPVGVVPMLVHTSETMLCVLDQDDLPVCATGGEPGTFRRIVPVPPLLDLVANDDGWSGDARFCGRARVDSTIWCWAQQGANWNNAERIIDLPLAAVDLGYDFGCGLDEGGLAWCWGANSAGQLGVAGPSSSVPIPVAGGRHFNSINAGSRTACATTATGEVWCWGELAWPTSVSTPQLIEAASPDVPHVVVGVSRDVYVRRAGSVRVHFTRDNPAIAQAFFRNLAIRDLVGGYGELCAIVESGAVYCGYRMITGISPTTTLPTELVPVPDPASQVNP